MLEYKNQCIKYEIETTENIYEEDSISEFFEGELTSSPIQLENDTSFLNILNIFNKIINNITNNTDIYNLIIDNIISIYTQEIGINLLVKGLDNNIFQITDTKRELELLKNMSNNINLSIIDLGECEKKIKRRILNKR